ncbi:hypothetical protein MSHO_32600 [Mycobacterium shottsii]|uniref:Uncharacterized protein n=1 Tax=Mycobacterium shottsii TaxID=133549 RepID=A0A7I7LDQ7_9MYCO|nr:hypothetical protein MSHO_32600 [Mycobacterium shottsii]
MKHESQPLGRGQRVQHDKKRQAHRIGQHRVVFGVERCDAIHDRIRQLTDQLFSAPAATIPH